MKLDCEEETVVVKYGLRLKKSGQILGYYNTSNQGSDFCGETSTRLSDLDGYPMWLVDKAYIAAYVRQFSTEWYNAGYETPQHSYEPEELELTVVKMITRTRPLIVKIPTVEEYFRIRYGEGSKHKNLEHLEMVLKDIKEHPDISYSLYDLKELMREGLIKS